MLFITDVHLQRFDMIENFLILFVNASQVELPHMYSVPLVQTHYFSSTPNVLRKERSPNSQAPQEDLTIRTISPTIFPASLAHGGMDAEARSGGGMVQ